MPPLRQCPAIKKQPGQRTVGIVFLYVYKEKRPEKVSFLLSAPYTATLFGEKYRKNRISFSKTAGFSFFYGRFKRSQYSDRYSHTAD